MSSCTRGNSSAPGLPAAVSQTEAGYLDGVTSAIQTQLDAKVTSPTWTTFTPTVTLVGGAGNQVPVYTVNYGRYLQVGKLIHVQVRLSGDGGNEGAGTGQFAIALPAASGATASPPFDTFVGRAINNATNYMITPFVDASSSVAVFQFWSSATASDTFTGAHQNHATRFFCTSFFYEAA